MRAAVRGGTWGGWGGVCVRRACGRVWEWGLEVLAGTAVWDRNESTVEVRALVSVLACAWGLLEWDVCVARGIAMGW